MKFRRGMCGFRPNKIYRNMEKTHCKTNMLNSLALTEGWTFYAIQYFQRLFCCISVFIKRSHYVIQCRFIHAQFKQIIIITKWIKLTCAIVATTRPNVNATCTTLIMPYTAELSPLDIVDATPTATKKNVPKNSANSIFHILRLFRMSLTPIIRLTPAKTKKNVNRENGMKEKICIKNNINTSVHK